VTLVNASGESKTPPIRSPNDAECLPKFGWTSAE